MVAAALVALLLLHRRRRCTRLRSRAQQIPMSILTANPSTNERKPLCPSDVQTSLVSEKSSLTKHSSQPRKLPLSPNARHNCCTSRTEYFTPNSSTAQPSSSGLQPVQSAQGRSFIPAPLWQEVAIPPDAICIVQNSAGQDWMLGQGAYSKVSITSADTHVRHVLKKQAYASNMRT